MKINIFCAILLVPLVGFSHTQITSSTPEKDSVVHLAPGVVEVKFSEILETAMSSLVVKDKKTSEIVSESPVKSDSAQKELKVNLKKLKNEKALYLVFWKAVSKDGHKMKGAYEFTFDPITK